MITNFSSFLGKWIWARNLNPQYGVQSISYGIEILIRGLIKLIVILAIGLLLDNIFLPLLAGVSFGLLRVFSGGYHAKTFTKCLLISSFIIYSSVILSIVMTENLSSLMGYIVIVAASLLTFTLIARFGPKITKRVYIIDNRSIFKKRALLIVIFGTILSLCFFSIYPNVSLTIQFAMAFQSLSLINNNQNRTQEEIK